MKATRGRPYGRAAATAQKWATKLHAALFRATAGRVGGRLVGCPVLLLNAAGLATYEDYQRKTDREIPVVVLHPVA